MASIIKEYLDRKLNILELQDELQKLIKDYNNLTGRCIFVYASDINKGRVPGLDVSLVQDDFYTIQDMLREGKSEAIDIYLETPGGSGEAAEEIAKFLRNKFKEVNFVIAGEAKSAGTILALSGDNIYMTETGSLGPIDAQVRIGRYIGSAHDYKQWVEEKKREALVNKALNPVDALIIAQISPLELSGVINSLEFAMDLVKEWLEKYKFKKWTVTQTQQRPVTDEMRKLRAKEIAEKLVNHTTWRTHGRSLKINDLKDDLLIENVDSNPKMAVIVYRIKTVIRLIFDSSTIYKLYFLEDLKLAKTFVAQQPGTQIPNFSIPQQIPEPGKHPLEQPMPNTRMPIPQDPTNVMISIKCPQCGKQHQVPGYFDKKSEEIAKLGLLVNPNVKDNDFFICDNCNFALDLKPLKAGIELQANKTIIFK